MERIRNWARTLNGTIGHPDFPYRAGDTPMPLVLKTMFWTGIALALAALGFAIRYLLFGVEDFLAYEIVFLAVAVVGIALAYGIWAKLVYPRYLSMVVVAGIAVWANVEMIRTRSIDLSAIAALVGAYASIRYLLTNPDVKEYYRRDSTGVDEGPAEVHPT